MADANLANTRTGGMGMGSRSMYDRQGDRPTAEEQAAEEPAAQSPKMTLLLLTRPPGWLFRARRVRMSGDTLLKQVAGLSQSAAKECGAGRLTG